MADEAETLVPSFEDSDVAWACGVLGLPKTAFSGDDGNDPRLAVLRSAETRDIEACPGSGKTTLLVAKLAILARKWPHSRQGLCVLSHTNVARREIETRLGNTAAGQRLLRYPHFIGTIHGFVNEFLALPWLRSQGYPVEMIDDEVCLRRRWRKLSVRVRTGLETNRYTEQRLRFEDTDFGIGEVRWGRSALGEHTPTYQAMRAACEESAQEGYFCHDEMFVWAHDMIDRMPEIVESLRMRFPLLFIDEVQDNSELQSKLLHRLFVEGDAPVTRQRFGDSNQAIYQHAGQREGAETDAFPVAAARADVPNSFRFDQGIADLANPLGVDPQGLQGLRQQGADGTSDTVGKHAIFLFDDAQAANVLGCYGAYLTEVFSDEELRHGSFAAVGAVHRPKGDDNPPRSVQYYWPAYDHEISVAEPQPSTLVQYVTAGRRLAHRSGESYSCVEKLAGGILRLVRLTAPDLKLKQRKRRHRYVLDLLEGMPGAQYVYLDAIRALCVDGATLTQESWEDEWQAKMVDVVTAIAGIAPEQDEAHQFLAWTDAVAAGQDDAGLGSDNVFRHPASKPEVEIRVGSIHSVKGETHTATLVMDTYFFTHHLRALKRWLTGAKSGGAGESARMQSRLRLHYVAMSRPSHLLCLAMREDALTKADIGEIVDRGWKVGNVRDNGVEWVKPDN